MKAPQIGANGWSGRKSPSDIVHPSASTLAGNVLHSGALENWMIEETAERTVGNLGTLAHMAARNPAEAIEWIKSSRFAERDPNYMSPAERGTFVHSVMECWMEGVAGPEVPPQFAHQLQPLIDRLAEFFVENKPQPIAQEQVVYNTTVGTAGRFDLLCRFGAGPWADGHAYLVDAKTKDKSTTKRGYDVKPYGDSVALQLAAYKWADKVATFEPRVQGADKRWLYGGRVYLANQHELEACTSFDETFGVNQTELQTGVVLITPDWYRLHRVHTGPDVLESLAAVKKAWEWKYLTSKDAVAGAEISGGVG